jgi:hypothetical protein
VDEDDAPALHHLAEPAEPLHGRADLHLRLPPLSSYSDPIRSSVLGFWLGFRCGNGYYRWAGRVILAQAHGHSMVCRIYI